MSRLRRKQRSLGVETQEAADEKAVGSPLRTISSSEADVAGSRSDNKLNESETEDKDHRAGHQYHPQDQNRKQISGYSSDHKQSNKLGGESKTRTHVGQDEQRDGALQLKADKDLEPIRTDPVRSLRLRRALLDRVAAESIPELHVIGEIRSGSTFHQSSSEGISCSWSLHHGKYWNLLSPDTNGQTQYGYAELDDFVVFNHPIDIHLAAKSLAEWPRLLFRAVKIDMFGRQIFLGCGFAHLPAKAGCHEITVKLWRPVGASEEELAAYFLGHVPTLVSDTPIYETARRDRCKLVTSNAGELHLRLFVLTRHFEIQNMDTVAPQK